MPKPADVVFTNGPLFTSGAARSRAGSVAVRDGRIVALGPDALELGGPRTDMVDLSGKLLIPGFQDAHVHAVEAGLQLGRCDLSGVVEPSDCFARISAYAERNPGLEWIIGAGWALRSFPGGLPTAAMLDSLVPDRPVFLANKDHHGAWVNSRAMELAGITADTPDPSGGRIERDADGRPSGMLQEAAMELVARHLPHPDDAELDAALLRAQKHLHSLGITGWQDALVGAALGMPDNYEAYVRAAQAGTLTARVRGALWWRSELGIEQLAELRHRRERGRVGRFDPGSVKIMQDGIIESRTAGTLAPYLDPCGCGKGGTGLSYVEPQLLCDYVTELDRSGFQVHFHAIGDRAVREALGAVEAARVANGPSTNRHHLAHLEMIHPDDLRRFAALDVGATVQPLWACHAPQMDELIRPLLGAERFDRQFPFGSLHREGATIAMGSDWPVSSPDPIAGVHVAVNRTAPGEDTASFAPGERLDLATALSAYTAGSAWANHRDDTGAIRVGNQADLVVLDRDPFDAPVEEIHEAKVVATYVAGKHCS